MSPSETLQVLFLSHCWFATVFVLWPGDVAGQFIAAPPTCPGGMFTFRCNVSGDMSGITIWREGGNVECILVHRTTSSVICGKVFIARSGTGFGTSDATSFSSSLSGTAAPPLDGTMVECFGPASNVDPGNRIDGSTLQIVGSPTIPTLSCVDLSEDVSGAVNVTVSWTLSGGDGADFYLIAITTNAPNTPYGGLLNITNASVTQYKLTGFMAGYQYNITVRGVNCGSQEGNESEPLIFTPEIPATPITVVCAVYDMENEALQIIESTWNEVDRVAVSKSCTNGQDTSYELAYTTASGTLNTTCVVDGTECSNGICRHELQSNTADSICQPPVSQFSGDDVTVSVTARNIVGRSNPVVSNSFATRNVDLGVRINTAIPSSAIVECSFSRPGYTCTIDYGTDPSYTNLVYRDISSTLGQIVTIVLSQRLRADTIYYYTVSAENDSQCVRVQGRFWAGCIKADLSDYNGTVNTARCADRGLANSLSISGGVVCFNGTTAGSRVVYICNDGFFLVGGDTRVCQSNGNWNGSIPQCVPEESVQIGPIVVGGVVGGSIGIVLIVIIIVVVTFVVFQAKQHSDASHLLEQYIIDDIEKGNLSAIIHWLQNENTKVNKCRGGRAYHRHFVLADGTALHWAVYYGQLEIARELLSQHADPWQRTKGGETILHWASLAYKENPQLLQSLLDFNDKNGLLVNVPENFLLFTPLHLACWDSNKELVQQLLEAGADRNARDRVGATPKDRLSEEEGNYQEIVNLLDNKSKPVLREDIIKAIGRGDKSTVEEWLKEKDTKVNECKGGKAFPGHNAVANGTALHWAALYGQLEIAELLFANGADMYQNSNWNENVLHWACQGKNKDIQLLKLLLGRHDGNEANKPFVNVPDSAWHFTPLHYACGYNNKEIIQCLLNAGADPNARDKYGATPKDRLSEEEENYQEIVDLPDWKSEPVPQQQSDPASKKPTSEVQQQNETTL